MSEFESKVDYQAEINRVYRSRELIFLQTNGLITSQVAESGSSLSGASLDAISQEKDKMVTEIDRHVDEVTEMVISRLGVPNPDSVRMTALKAARTILEDYTQEPNRSIDQLSMANKRLSFIDQKIESIQKAE